MTKVHNELLIGKGRLSKPLTAAEFWQTIANMNRDLSHEWEVARV
ncbi:hypothetical protein ACVPOW_12575 [Staphylococcus aureus]